MHRAEYFADFKWDEELEHLYLCIYANYKNEVTEVYNEYEDGKTRIRCIYPIMYAGYLFAPIGEKQHITYYQEWYERGEMNILGGYVTKESIIEYIRIWKRVINDPKNQNKYIAIVNCHD